MSKVIERDTKGVLVAEHKFGDDEAARDFFLEKVNERGGDQGDEGWSAIEGDNNRFVDDEGSLQYIYTT